jgi:uncharacterized protein YlzI (FlbEa/FlbD family)
VSAFVRVVTTSFGDASEMWVRPDAVEVVRATPQPDTVVIGLDNGDTYFVSGTPAEVRAMFEGAGQPLPGAAHPARRVVD